MAEKEAAFLVRIPYDGDLHKRDVKASLQKLLEQTGSCATTVEKGTLSGDKKPVHGVVFFGLSTVQDMILLRGSQEIEK